MGRAQLGSLVFVGGLLFVTAMPEAEGYAMAEPYAFVEDEGSSTGPSSGDHAAEGEQALLDARFPTAIRRGGEAPSAKLANPEAAPLPLASACPDGMVEVEGDYCPTLEQKCLKWMDGESTVPRRCAEFAETGACQGKMVRKHFCIDRYEFPNKAGERPAVMKTWYEARDACSAQGKRLCGDSEWTLACEGRERLPYPYGHVRNSEACNIDKPHPNVDEKALANPLTRAAEVERLWQGEESGSREACVSPYGAYDMTGNVDEWVVNESGVPFKSGLKGGYWGPVRDRCRPMTTAHFEQFSFYQIGFRCCADAPDDASLDEGGARGGGGHGSAPFSNAPPASLAGS